MRQRKEYFHSVFSAVIGSIFSAIFVLIGYIPIFVENSIKMLIFQTIKTLFRILGYLEPRLPAALQKYPIKRIQNLIVFFTLIFGFGSLFWFLKCEARTFNQYAIAFAHFIGTFHVLSSYCILAKRKSKILQLIADFERLIQQSKFSPNITFFQLILNNTTPPQDVKSDWRHEFMKNPIIQLKNGQDCLRGFFCNLAFQFLLFRSHFFRFINISPRATRLIRCIWFILHREFEIQTPTF